MIISDFITLVRARLRDYRADYYSDENLLHTISLALNGLVYEFDLNVKREAFKSPVIDISHMLKIYKVVDDAGDEIEVVMPYAYVPNQHARCVLKLNLLLELKGLESCTITFNEAIDVSMDTYIPLPMSSIDTLLYATMTLMIEANMTQANIQLAEVFHNKLKEAKNKLRGNINAISNTKKAYRTKFISI